MKQYETAMSSATVMGIVGEWPGFREMGISIDGCEVRKVRPKQHGGLEVQYQFDLSEDHGARPHIVWSGLHLAWPEEGVRSHTRTFLSAYRQEIPASLMRRIDFYHRACLLRIACRVSLRPMWQHLAIPLLAACKAGVRGEGSGDRELEKRDE